MSLPDPLQPYAARNNTAPPDRLGRRYSATGFLPEAGNTVVCHLNRADPAHEAVLAARTRMQALPEADRFLFTPVSSLHMTVFEGAIETRRTPDAWPAGLDRDAPVDEVTDWMLDRFAAFAPPDPFNVRLADLRPTGLLLTGATDHDLATMRAWREALTGPFAYRHEDHDSYRFHMTFAYPTGWLSDAALPEWRAAFHDMLEELSRAATVIPLNPPAFCSFADMTHFEELLVLGR